MSGCLDFLPDEVREPLEEILGQLGPKPGTLYATQFVDDDWNRQRYFSAQIVHDEPLSISFFIVRISDNAELSQLTPASEAIEDPPGVWTNSIDTRIPDGEWHLSLYVDGMLRNEWKSLRIDATPPQFQGLETVGHASEGAYLIGEGATWESGASVAVRGPDGNIVAQTLPLQVSGLGDGLHAYKITLTDQAGNQRLRTVQVLAGDAKALPEGQHTAGIVARYTNNVQVWDISAPWAYLSRDEAATQEPGYLGSGFGITPNNADVQQVVADVVTDSMNTMESALALYRWLFDELEYTEERLEASDLLEPSETFANGGGVCRDLAAAYVSLLRAANVPARLVTGYLAGDVNGFHAWVEFYAGSVDGRPGWVPVDVSPIDGQWDDNSNGDGATDGEGVLFQAFGIRLPNYLPLRALPSNAEVDGWATAIGVSYSYEGDAPEFDYAKDLKIEGSVGGVLCVDLETRARRAAADSSDCSSGDVYYGGSQHKFILQTTQILDYGVVMHSADPGTDFDISLAVPFASEILPVVVSHDWYVDHTDVDVGSVSEGKRTITVRY